MDDANVPVGFIILRKLESGKSILKESLVRIFFSFSLMIVGLLLFKYGFQILSIIFLVPSLFLLLVFIMEFQRKNMIMSTISVNLGHPWVEEEHDIDEADVAYRTLEKWEILPRKGRVKKNMEGKGLLIDNDEEFIFEISKPLIGWFFFDEWESELMKWLNLALAIRDAQNLVEDEIESARSREDDEELDVERNWPETNPGELNVKPGAIFRKFSKVKK